MTSPLAARLKAHLKSLAVPAFLGKAAVAVVVGALVGVAAGRKLGEPEMQLARHRYQAQLGMAKLYDRQIAFRKARGRYANDLNTLLAASADGPALKTELGERVDLNTLVVKGDAKRFRLEANVLDPERTLIKVKGP